MRTDRKPADETARDEHAPDKELPITLAEAAEVYGFSRNYLGNLVRSGRLRAHKSGGTWLTTPADVEAFIASRQRRGKYRDDIGA